VGMSITGSSTSSLSLFFTIAGVLQSHTVDLPFDATADFHNYAISFDYEGVTYFVDQEPVYTVSRSFYLSGPSNVILNVYPVPGYEGSATAYWKSIQFGNDYQIDTPYGDIKVSKTRFVLIQEWSLISVRCSILTVSFLLSNQYSLSRTLEFGLSPAVNLGGGVYRVSYSITPLRGASPNWVDIGTSTSASIDISFLPLGSYVFRVRAETGISVSNWSFSRSFLFS